MITLFAIQFDKIIINKNYKKDHKDVTFEKLPLVKRVRAF